MRFLDTNILLEQQEKVFENGEFMISSKTLEEIENIKSSGKHAEDVRFKARHVAHLLNDNFDKYEVQLVNNDVYRVLNEFGLPDTPDNGIVACAFLHKNEDNFIFETLDLNCRNLARALGIPVLFPEIHKTEGLYVGYKEIVMTDNEMASLYQDPKNNKYELVTNEYIVIKNENKEVVDVRKWNGEMYDAIKMKPFKSTMFGTLKPLDEIQLCAMDSLTNNEITVLYGKAGSGKTTLPLNLIMQGIEKGKFSKCYIVYSYEPLRNAKVLGFEKGSHEDKLLMYGAIGNILGSKFGSIDQVRYMLEHGQIDIIPTANIRGVEFEADSVMLCTEAQNLDTYTLKTIVQRCKSGCKQIYEGDIIEQKDVNVQNVGMNRLIDVFKGHEKFGCIKLKNTYRSELTELADLM